MMAELSDLGLSSPSNAASDHGYGDIAASLNAEELHAQLQRAREISTSGAPAMKHPMLNAILGLVAGAVSPTAGQAFEAGTAARMAPALAQHTAEVEQANKYLEQRKQMASGVRMLLQARPELFSDWSPDVLGELADVGGPLTLPRRDTAGDLTEVDKARLGILDKVIATSTDKAVTAAALNEGLRITKAKLPEVSWRQLIDEGGRVNEDWVRSNVVNFEDVLSDPFYQRTHQFPWGAKGIVWRDPDAPKPSHEDLLMGDALMEFNNIRKEAADRNVTLSDQQTLDKMTDPNRILLTGGKYREAFPTLGVAEAAREYARLMSTVPPILQASRTGMLKNGADANEIARQRAWEGVQSMQSQSDKEKLDRFIDSVQQEQNAYMAQNPKATPDQAAAYAENKVYEDAKARGVLQTIPSFILQKHNPQAAAAVTTPSATSQSQGAPTAAPAPAPAAPPAATPAPAPAAAPAPAPEAFAGPKHETQPTDLKIPASIEADPMLKNRFITNSVISRAEKLWKEMKTKRNLDAGAAGVIVEPPTVQDLEAAVNDIPGFDLDDFAEVYPDGAKRIKQKLTTLSRKTGI